MPLTVLRRAVCALLALPTLVVAAETEVPSEPQPDPAVLEETVEVTAERPGEGEPAAFATELTPVDLGSRGEDLADVLRRVPGAKVHDYGGLGSYATMSLRASTSEQVVVLVDGVPQNRALGGPVDLSSIPATQIAGVTVYRGFGPAQYGLGGIGGVVDVRTRAPSARPEVQLDLLGGQCSTVRASGAYSTALGGGAQLRIGAEWLSSAGDYPYYDTGETLFDPSDDAERRRANNDVEDLSTLVQYAQDRVGGGRLNAVLRLQDRERGTPGVGTLATQTARAEDHWDGLSLGWTRELEGWFDSVELDADGFRQEIVLSDPNGEVGLSAEERSTDLSGGGVAALLRTNLSSQRALVRFDVRRETAAVRDTALAVPDRGGARRATFAVTAEDLIVANQVTIAPSLRWERRIDDFIAGGGGTLPPPADDVTDDAWSGKLGAAWALRPQASLRGSIGRFHRSPSLLELFGNRGALIGNPELRPEQGIAAELGYAMAQRADRCCFGELVAFARRTEDLIAFLPVAQGIAVARNVGRADAYGLEASFSARLARAWALDVTATRQETKDASGGFNDGMPLPYQPETLGYLGVGYSGRRLRARWDVSYTGGNSTDSLDTPEFRLPARFIHDASVNWLLARGIEIGIDVSNVAGLQTRDLLRYPLPDRVVLLHVGWHGPSETP